MNSEANVSAMVEEHVQMNETLVQMGAPHSLTVETLGHSEEVETMSMEVDVQVSFYSNSLLNSYLNFYFLNKFPDFRSGTGGGRNQFYAKYRQFHGSH